MAKIEKSMRALQSAISPSEEDDPATDGHSDADKKSGGGEREVSSTLPNARPRPKATDKSKHKWYQVTYWRDRSLEWWKPRFEVVALGFGIGYAVITYFQWHDANSNFRSGQRAWVLVDGLDYPTEFVPNQKFPTSTILKNFGASPALEVHGRTDYYTFGEACEPLHNNPMQNNFSATLAPGQSATYSGTSVTLSSACITAIKSDAAQLIMRETITYKDIFHRSHTTNSCSRYNGTRAIFQACNEESSTD